MPGPDLHPPGDHDPAGVGGKGKIHNSSLIQRAAHSLPYAATPFLNDSTAAFSSSKTSKIVTSFVT